MPSKWTFHQNSSLQHIIWNVMSYLRQLRHEMIVLLNWLNAVEKFGTFNNLRWTLLTLSRHLNCTKNEKYNDDDDDEWYCVLYHLQFADVSCLWSIHFFIFFKPLILSNYGKITWMVKIRIILLLNKFPKKYKMYQLLDWIELRQWIEYFVR